MSDKAEAAERLARIHYQSASTSLVFSCSASVAVGSEDSPDEPIKLLEVDEQTIPSGIVPLRFGPVPEQDINCSSVIIEVTPEEYQKIERGELKLPAGWETRRLVARPAEVVSSQQ